MTASTYGPQFTADLPSGSESAQAFNQAVTTAFQQADFELGIEEYRITEIHCHDGRVGAKVHEGKDDADWRDYIEVSVDGEKLDIHSVNNAARDMVESEVPNIDADAFEIRSVDYGHSRCEVELVPAESAQ